MDDKTKQEILAKNQRLIDMVIERAKRDFPEDIAIIGLSGSFLTEDFHEKSDLDLIIINNTDRGWGISFCFILDDVGYDIYCTPWHTRIEAEANLDSPGISNLLDIQILYCAKPEYLERLRSYQQRALDELNKPVGAGSLSRAQKCIDEAKREYAEACLTDDIGAVRYASGSMFLAITGAINQLNNTYFRRGIRRYIEELNTRKHLPQDFERNYRDMIEAKTADEIRNCMKRLLKSVIALHSRMSDELLERPVPTFENLEGTYEELWCNLRNKVIRSALLNDKSYAFLCAVSAQDHFNEMTRDLGTRKFDVLSQFDADDLEGFRDRFLRMMDEYLEEYHAVGRKVARYDCFEDLYREYMGAGQKT